MKKTIHTSPFTLHISEIFSSIQGESYLAGLPTIFVRLTGCHLRCKYCDSKHAYRGGKKMSSVQIIRRISRSRPIRRICITGGEPLLQKGVYPLMRELLKRKYQVSLETSGTLDISSVPRQVIKVMDVKTPGSRGQRVCVENLKHLDSNDEVKFVVTNKRDVDWSLRMIRKHGINKICRVSLSPVMVGGASCPERNIRGGTPLLPRIIAKKILHSGLDNVRLQVQLHKMIGLR